MAGMTDDLFRQDAYLRECSAHITAVTEAGIVLDRTVFYPLGGGQAGDSGVLMLADGTELAIVDTRKGKDAEGRVRLACTPGGAEMRASTRASLASGGGRCSAPCPTRTRQVEQRPRPPQTEAWGILFMRLISSSVRPRGTATALPP